MNSKTCSLLIHARILINIIITVYESCDQYVYVRPYFWMSGEILKY